MYNIEQGAELRARAREGGVFDNLVVEIADCRLQIGGGRISPGWL